MTEQEFYCNVFVYETVAGTASIVEIAAPKQMCHSPQRAYVNITVLGHGSSRFKEVLITVLTMRR